MLRKKLLTALKKMLLCEYVQLQQGFANMSNFKEFYKEQVFKNPSRVQDFLKLLNDFRDEYYNGNAPFKITYQHLMNEQNGENIIGIYYRHNRPIAIIELVKGNIYNNYSMQLATIYVIPKYRSSNVANWIYDKLEEVIEGAGAKFCMQVEEGSVLKNCEKLIKSGFEYYAATKINGDSQYKENTYLLFRTKYCNEFLPMADIGK